MASVRQQTLLQNPALTGSTPNTTHPDLTVGGVPLTLLDTAGIREAADTVEKIGVERSQAAAVNADIVVMVIDAAGGSLKPAWAVLCVV